MKKTQTYYRTYFPPDILKTAIEKFFTCSREANQSGKPDITEFRILGLDLKDCSWEYDTFNEFLADYKKSKGFPIYITGDKCELTIYSSPLIPNTVVCVTFATREDIESVFQIFDLSKDIGNIVVKQAPIKIFIGHGRDRQWLEVKNHLQDQHGFEIVAYEVGPRAGLSIKQVLETMLNQSSFAILILTGEDIRNDGELTARPNVIHELGLFQGRLGFERAVILLEDGVKEFSNILGVNQLRFSKGTISETYGDILATIRREFGRV